MLASGTSAIEVAQQVGVPLVPDQAGDGGLAVAEVTGKGCERMTQHMRGDVARQITELGDLSTTIFGNRS